MKFVLGSYADLPIVGPFDENHEYISLPSFECDLEALIGKKLLVQAMSGAGKSWLIRRILEQVFGHVQIIVLDSEGDFKTLREKFPYVLIGGDDGDIPVTVGLAKPLALKLLELRSSAIIDISMLEVGRKDNERCDFVAEFLTSLLRSPQRLWHPTLVVLDEAQEFAPERFSASSTEAVIQMSGQARKRGFGFIPATNRLSELSKSVAAHCKSKLIGGSMGIDAGKAAFELGFKPKEQERIQALEPGEFFAFGPAFERGVHLVRIGEVETTHPSPSGRGLTPVPPPMKEVRGALADLAKLLEQEKKPAEPVEHPSSGVGDKRLQERIRELTEENEEFKRECGTIREEVVSYKEHVERLSEEVARNRLDAESFRKIRELLTLPALYQEDGERWIAPAVDTETIVQAVLARLPANGAVPVQVTPPEALRKKYLTDAVTRTYEKVSSIGDKPRRMIELLLSKPVFWNVSAINKALGRGSGGNQAQEVREVMKDLIGLGIVLKGGVNRAEYKTNVDGFVKLMLDVHDPTDEEISSVVQHVLARLVS